MSVELAFSEEALDLQLLFLSHLVHVLLELLVDLSVFEFFFQTFVPQMVQL